jgi:hypothetical protein
MKTTIKPCLCAFLGTLLLSTAAGLAPRAHAVIPSVERLLPDDTLIMVTAPDFTKLRDAYYAAPQSQLWSDPSMKAFRDHFTTKLNDEIVKPLERELGVRLENYASLPQGQLTVAMVKNSAKPTSPGFLLLLDTKSQSGQLKTNLAELKRKWLDSGKSIKTEKIREIEFSILPLSADDLPESLKKFVAAEEDEDTEESDKAEPAELVLGQFESLLILGNSIKAVERVAVHLTGGSTPRLGDLAAYESSHVSIFRDAPLYGWANAKSLLEHVTRQSADEESENPVAAMFGTEKIIAATGLGGLRTLAFSLQSSIEGTFGRITLGIPESGRQGLFKLFPSGGKESTPPAFVPADAVKFQRLRIDGQSAWNTIRGILAEVSPEMNNGLDFVLNTANEAAQQKDPNFDLRKSLFGNLGDDLIGYEKIAKGTTPDELSSGPSMLLIASPQPEQFASALKAVFALMNPQAGTPTEREFLGRKIYSVASPASAFAPGSSGATFNYCASGGYVAITTDVPLLEEFLRSSDGEQKQLRDKSGLREAIAKVGGGSTGWFSYENQAETIRPILELLRQSAAKSDEPEMLAPGIPAFTPENPFKEWTDFSLLPAFDQIAKYFSFTVYSGVANSEGITFNLFEPVPPDLRK